MRLRARPQLHYAPVPGGVYLSGARAQFAMRGPAALFTVVDVCVPLLEAGATEDELVTALGSERARPVVRQLTAGLRGHGMLLDLDALSEPEPAPEVRSRYPEALAHLESVSDDPYAHFAALRTASVLLAGPPQLLLPALRGLHRAGVGRLLLATDAAEQVAATADRIGAETVPDGAAAPETDAVLVCHDPDRPHQESRFAGHRLVVPVVLGERVLVVGPVGDGRSAPARAQALAARAHTWAQGEEHTTAVRPAADALAGALAGHLLFEALTGSGTAGEAHVVHGPDLSSSRVVLPHAEPDGPGPADLTRVTPAPAPDADALVEAVTAVTTRWTGDLALEEAGTLPQLPLALRALTDRAPGAGATAAWGADQRSATAAVALDALRGRCAAQTPSAAPAAGPTEERWLLDGALRLLAAGTPADTGAETVHVDLAGEEETGPESRRIVQALPDAGLPPETLLVRLHQVGGVDWPLAEVCDRESGTRLAAAWGADREQALHAALATVLATAQVRSAGPPLPATEAVHTGALLTADADTVAALRAQLAERAAAHGVRYAGTPRAQDPVLGPLPLWSGTVEARPASPGEHARD